jgi:hypothetical protein
MKTSFKTRFELIAFTFYIGEVICPPDDTPCFRVLIDPLVNEKAVEPYRRLTKLCIDVAKRRIEDLGAIGLAVARRVVYFLLSVTGKAGEEYY